MTQFTNEHPNAVYQLAQMYPIEDEPRGLPSEADRVQLIFDELVKRFHMTEAEAHQFIDQFEQ
jgi:hypothetical protein